MKRRARPTLIPAFNGERVYTAEQASELLQLALPTIRAAIRSGTLAAARIGRLYRIRESDLQRYVEAHMMRQAAKA